MRSESPKSGTIALFQQASSILPQSERITIDAEARIHELLHWFDAADLVLAEVLEDTLSREELGLAAPVTDASDE